MHFHLRLLLPVLLCCFAATAAAQDTLKPKRIYTAQRIAQAPRIDGQLTDACWTTAAKAESFTQFLPHFGEPAALPTIAYLVYDDYNIYVGAEMPDPEPNKIMRTLTPRDQGNRNNADGFAIGFDTYKDGINAFRFEISAAGVQTDGRLTPDNYDLNWDAVWESRVAVTGKGWNVELRIPYSALRFPKQEVQRWGVQFVRTIQRFGEINSWSPIDPKVSNIVQQWGILEGLEHIDAPLRLSFTPYVAGYLDRNPVGVNPTLFHYETHASGGMDIKYGVNESFTLDATLIPDFGQVQSDNTVLNLSQFEVRYDERRPFFTEGTELFNKDGIFYSRRIGARPAGYYDVFGLLGPNEEIHKNPSQTRLYNATKFSGRTGSGLGIGILNALAAPTFASIIDTVTQQTRDVQTSVLSNYNILVLDQNLRNNSSFTFTNANTLRDGLSRDANVAAATLSLNNKTTNYQFRATGRHSYVNDLQVPDSMRQGYYYNVNYGKKRGKFQFDAGQYAFSRDWDPSDLGLLNAYNLLGNQLFFQWLDFDPKKHLLNWNVSLKGEYKMQLEPLDYQSLQITNSWNATLKNLSSGGIFMQTIPAWYNDFYEARIPGKKFWHAPYVYFLPYFQTDQRKAFQWYGQIEFAESPIPNDPLYGGASSFFWRLNSHFNFTLFSEATHDNSNFGFAGYDPSTDIVTIGRRDIFVTNNELSMEYNINPRMGVNFRARHYWSKVVYDQFYNLLGDGRLETIAFQEGRDFNFNVFNIDFVYSWQFAPGSFFNLVWKNSIGASDSHGEYNYMMNLKNTIESPAYNSLIVKMIYYLDYQRLKEIGGRKKGVTTPATGGVAWPRPSRYQV